MKAELLKSPAIQSFGLEISVAEEFQKNNWSVVNSCHYKDLKENKIREIDVVASISGSSKGKYAVSRVNAVVECKTMRGFHIVANKWAEVEEGESEFDNFHWAGSSKQNRAYLFGELLKKGIDEKSREKIFDHLNSWFFPYQPERVFRLALRSYSIGIECSGFRETNIGSEKELDNSVIWRASLAIKSAIESFNQEANESKITDFDEALEQFRPSDFPKATKKLLWHLDYVTNIVENYHPIIVTDAKIWVMEKRDIKEKPAIRLYQRGLGDIFNSWVDVVNYSYLPTYIQNLTAYYKRKYKEKKLRFSSH